MMVEVTQNICLIVIGMASGLSVAAGVFAFISVLGVIPRLCARFHLAVRVHQVETCVAVGGTLGTVCMLFGISIPAGQAGIILFGFCSGIFVGALAMALAETLRVIPVLCQRLRLKHGLPYVVLCMALGKMAGSFFQLVM